MDNKKMIWMGVLVGSTVGSLIPLAWGASELSFSSIIFGALGGFLGIYLTLRLIN